MPTRSHIILLAITIVAIILPLFSKRKAVRILCSVALLAVLSICASTCLFAIRLAADRHFHETGTAPSQEWLAGALQMEGVVSPVTPYIVLAGIGLLILVNSDRKFDKRKGP